MGEDGNGYKLIKTDEIREWDNDKRIWIPGYLMQQIDRGGAAAGAFVNGRMIGFASLDGILRIEFLFRHGMFRACMKIVNTPKQRVFFRHTALNFLSIRQILQRAHRAPVQNHRA